MQRYAHVHACLHIVIQYIYFSRDIHTYIHTYIHTCTGALQGAVSDQTIFSGERTPIFLALFGQQRRFENSFPQVSEGSHFNVIPALSIYDSNVMEFQSGNSLCGLGILLCCSPSWRVETLWGTPGIPGRNVHSCSNCKLAGSGIGSG